MDHVLKADQSRGLTGDSWLLRSATIVNEVVGWFATSASPYKKIIIFGMPETRARQEFSMPKMVQRI